MAKEIGIKKTRLSLLFQNRKKSIYIPATAHVLDYDTNQRSSVWSSKNSLCPTFCLYASILPDVLAFVAHLYSAGNMFYRSPWSLSPSHPYLVPPPSITIRYHPLPSVTIFKLRQEMVRDGTLEMEMDNRGIMGG